MGGLYTEHTSHMESRRLKVCVGCYSFMNLGSLQKYPINLNKEWNTIFDLQTRGEFEYITSEFGITLL